MEQISIFNKYLDLLSRELQVLPDKSEETPENTLRALWFASAGIKKSPISAMGLDLPVLSSESLLELDGLIQSRLSGVPLAHLTERQSYMGLDYVLNKGLYIPRKETELLARVAIATIEEDFGSSKQINVLDLCTGIGTVALAIAHYCKNSRVYGSDIYSPAIEAAIHNAKHFSLEHRASFFNSDMFKPFESLALKNSTEIITSAPPYISSTKVKNMAIEISQHEPKEAFDAGPFGLSIFNKLISEAPEYLCIGGYLMFECGLGQGEFLSKRIRANPRYGTVTEIRDENGDVRVVKGQKSN